MSDARWGDPREYDTRDRGDEWPRVYDPRDRDDRDPRDALMRDLDLPRGDERELVVDRNRVYELDREDSGTLAAVGVFRVVPEHDLDLPRDTLDNLQDQRLVETVELGDGGRGLTLTTEGRDLLHSHSLERDAEPSRVFHAGASRSREIDHDSNLYATFRQEEARLRDEHDVLDIRRVVLEQDLKREYQEFLQDHNRNRSDSTVDQAVMRTKSATGRASTISRSSTAKFISLTTESSTRLTAGNFTRTSNSSRRTTAALTPPAVRRPASASTSSPLVVAAVARDRIRA
jgi:hypothetical protein